MAKTPNNKTGNAQFGKNQPANYCGKKGRSGAPRDNRNGMRHGLKAGQLPKDAKYIEIRLNTFRRTLEDAVIKAKGEVNLPDAAAIQTCIRWERHGCLAQRWLTKKYDELKPLDQLKFSEAIGKASESRDKALRSLGLDRDTKDGIIDALYTRLPAPNGKDSDEPT